MRTSSRRAGMWAVAVAAVSVLSAGCEIRAGEGGLDFGLGQSSAQDTWERTYPVAAGGRIEILNINGEVRAVASSGADVHVRAERKARGTSEEAAREHLRAIEMREEVGPSRVRVETVVPRRQRGGHEITYTVDVPAGVHVDLRTVNGGVRLENVGGEVRASSTNGGVKGRVAAASLIDARTTNGGVDLEVTGTLTSDAVVSLASVNGGVKVTVPADTRADVTARCTNGRVTVTDLTIESDATGESESRRRRLDGRLNGGGARIDLQTTNGGVSIGRS